MTRTVTLVVLAADGEIAGQTAAFDVGTPWWQEVSEVAVAVRERYGLELDVLRLLSAERNRPPGCCSSGRRLDERMAALADCGVPDTLGHGTPIPAMPGGTVNAWCSWTGASRPSIRITPSTCRSSSRRR